MTQRSIPPGRRDRVDIPRIMDVLWAPLVLRGSSPGLMHKVLGRGQGWLSETAGLPVLTALVSLPPSWFDPELMHHPCAEEIFILSGRHPVGLRGEGTYTYRPPGILHGSTGHTTALGFSGCVAVMRFGDPEQTDWVLRHPGGGVPYRNLEPVDDRHDRWPVGWVEALDCAAAPSVVLAGGGLDGAACRWLSRNRETGGGTALLELPAGWEGAGLRGEGAAELFFVQGDGAVGSRWYERWGYLARPRGDGAGAIRTPGGALLLAFLEEGDLA